MTLPRVVTFNVASLDGRITIAPGVLLLAGDARWEAIAGAGAADEAYARIKRLHRPELLLEGSGSLVAEDAPPAELPPTDTPANVLRADFLPREVVEDGRRGFFAAVDSRGRVRWTMKEFPGEEWAGWRLLVLVSHATPLPYLAFLRAENIPYVIAGDAKVDLRAAFATLHEKLGVRTIVSTGGGQLNGALLRAGLVDEVDVDSLPAIIGGRGTPALFDAPPLAPGEQPVRLTPIEVIQGDDGWLHARYEVVRPQG